MNPPTLALPASGRFPELRFSPVAIGALLLAIAFWPVWRWYGLRLNDGSDEPFGLVALGVAGWVLWQHRGRLAVTPQGAVAAAVLLAGYALGFHHLPAMIRALLAIGAIGAFIGIHRAPAAIWGLLALSLPVIATAQFFAGWPLRLTTAAGSEFLLNLAGIEAAREGTVLWWKETPIAVDPPCSGIRMLWAGLFVHFALAAIHRLNFRTLLWLTPLAVAAVILANVIRATLLFFKESGAIQLPDWTHAGIGIAVFGVMLAVFAVHYPRLGSPTETSGRLIPKFRVRPSFIGVLAMLAMLAAFKPLTKAASSASAHPQTEFPGWPSEFEGEALRQLPLSEQESAFAEDFPGELGAFETAAGRKVILRWVTRPTRKLHSSADCLRATGFTVETAPVAANAESGWAHWTVSHPDHGKFQAREQIREANSPGPNSWTEPSAWFWSASLGSTRGPWWAVTLIEDEWHASRKPPEFTAISHSDQTLFTRGKEDSDVIQLNPCPTP